MEGRWVAFDRDDKGNCNTTILHEKNGTPHTFDVFNHKNNANHVEKTAEYFEIYKNTLVKITWSIGKSSKWNSKYSTSTATCWAVESAGGDVSSEVEIKTITRD